MGAHVPVVATEIWRFVEDVQDGKTGLLVSSSDGLADAVIELLSNPTLFHKIDANLKAEIQAKSWARVENMVVQIYRTALRMKNFGE